MYVELLRYVCFAIKVLFVLAECNVRKDSSHRLNQAMMILDPLDRIGGQTRTGPEKGLRLRSQRFCKLKCFKFLTTVILTVVNSL